MVASPSPHQADALGSELEAMLTQVDNLRHGKLIRQVLETVARMAGRETDRLDWKILNYSLQDMERGFQMFYPYRHVRKITIFGSARTPKTNPEYQMARTFAQQVSQQGFMVMTGAGGGIMQAGNEGAGSDHSFGLNIQLPFEQGANPVMEDNPKLVSFKYFFTRKLFFLKESDALALFPGGFGTQDEAFESLTLIQTGKAGPLPLVLVDHPGGDYWRSWDRYIREHLLALGLVSPDDPNLYTITDSVDEACDVIARFYRVFHSCRYVGDQLVIRLKSALSEAAIAQLNQDFNGLLAHGQITASEALPSERGDETEAMPRLVLHFNNRDFGRLHQLICAINSLGADCPEVKHPEQK